VDLGRIVDERRLASLGRGGDRRAGRGSGISISANGPDHESVTYGVRGRVSKDGAIVAKFPGLGRVNVRFDQTEVNKLRDEVEPGCSVGRETLSRKGKFSGTIDLHAPGVLGTVRLRAAPGSILDFPAETCPVPKRSRENKGGLRDESEGSVDSPGSRSYGLHTGRKLDGGELSFDADALEAGDPFGTKDAPQFDFLADFSKSRHGLSTFATASAALVPSGLTVIDPTGAPTEATVEPPAPFHGSATFKLESPTTASWTGDLSVEIPTLGKVHLTAPGTWSTLCQGTACTETLPPGMQFAFLEF
jgi:hypothetical protein